MSSLVNVDSTSIGSFSSLWLSFYHFLYLWGTQLIKDKRKKKEIYECWVALLECFTMWSLGYFRMEVGLSSLVWLMSWYNKTISNIGVRLEPWNFGVTFMLLYHMNGRVSCVYWSSDRPAYWLAEAFAPTNFFWYLKIVEGF